MTSFASLSTSGVDPFAERPLPAASQLRTGLRGPLLATALATPLLFLGLVGWAAFTPLSSAVITSGQVAAEGQNRKLQHLDGGIVAGLKVHNGDHVRTGDVLVELDPTQIRTGLAIARSRLAASLALQTRLEAEQAGLAHDQPLVMDDLALRTEAGSFGADLASVQELARAFAGQEQIRAARADLRAGQVEATRERVAQLESQRHGLDGQIAALETQRGYVAAETADLVTLIDKGLAARPRLLDAQGRLAELEGALASQKSERAGIANAIRDAELAQVQADSEFREKVSTDLRTAGGEINELVQQIVTLDAQLSRVVMRAPVDGVVHQMALATIGGVVAPGETVLEIVPAGDAVEFEMRLDPRSVDQVHPGQVARVRFPAFNAQTTPELHGSVADVSATTIEDQRTGNSYYRVKLSVPAEELARLPEMPVPGMPVEAFLATGERSALSWLLKPISDHMGHAFREE